MNDRAQAAINPTFGIMLGVIAFIAILTISVELAQWMDGSVTVAAATGIILSVATVRVFRWLANGLGTQNDEP